MVCRLALLVSMIGLLSGCDSGVECPLLMSFSVTLDVVDAETQEYVYPAEVRYTVDGVEQEPAHRVGDSHHLSSAAPGHFEVTVEAEGYETVESEYTLDYQEETCSHHVEDRIELVAE